MDYTFTRDGVEEKVALERWGWGVVYKDDTELHQFDSNTKKFHQFKEIELESVKMFVMYHTNTALTEKRIDMLVSEGTQVFHFYRHLVLDNDTRRVKVYVFGWKRDGIASYNYILPDDRIITADHDISGLQNFAI